MRTWLTASSWQSIKNRANNPEKFNEKSFFKCFCSTCCSKNPRIKLTKKQYWAFIFESTLAACTACNTIDQVLRDTTNREFEHQIKGVGSLERAFPPRKLLAWDAMKCYFQALTGNICCKKIVNLPSPEISHVKLRVTYIHIVSQWF